MRLRWCPPHGLNPIRNLHGRRCMEAIESIRSGRDLILVLGCVASSGVPCDSPLLAAIPLRPEILRRVAELTRICEKHDLVSVTDTSLGLVPYWDFPETSAGHRLPTDLSCTWTAAGTLHYITLYGRLPDEELAYELAHTVMFDMTEWPRLARSRLRWDLRGHDDDPYEEDGLHRRILGRATYLFGS